MITIHAKKQYPVRTPVTTRMYGGANGRVAVAFDVEDQDSTLSTTVVFDTKNAVHTAADLLGNTQGGYIGDIDPIDLDRLERLVQMLKAGRASQAKRVGVDT